MRHIQLQTRQIPRQDTKAANNQKQLHHQRHIRLRQQSLKTTNRPQPKEWSALESFFTNIPTLETIDIILKRAYTNGETEYHGLEKDTLKKLLIICTQESHFQFNGKYYEQIDGVAMGSPLGPLFANIFMDEFEQTHMKKLTELGVLSWMSR